MTASLPAVVSLVIAFALAPCLAVVAGLCWHNRRDINRLDRRLARLEEEHHGR